jgi:hypothetical protein
MVDLAGGKAFRGVAKLFPQPGIAIDGDFCTSQESALLIWLD